MSDKLHPLFPFGQYLGLIILAVALVMCVTGMMKGDTFLFDAGSMWSVGGGLMFIMCYMMK